MLIFFVIFNWTLTCHLSGQEAFFVRSLTPDRSSYLKHCILWRNFESHSRTTESQLKEKISPNLKMPWPLCDQTDKRYSFVKRNKDRKKYVSLNNLHMNSHRNHTDRMFYKNILRSIDLCVLQDSCNELLWVFGDFYMSGVQDAEITKSLYTYCAESHPCAGGMRAFSIWVAMSLVAPLV